jgi:ubiquinone biosynthesis UbiH/UbiF/VisC/COQ6 family hydroxylase
VTTANRHEVVVVGGGVVGAALTLALKQGGYDVALVERGNQPRPYDKQRYDLRVYAIAPGTANLLAKLGVWPAIAAARISPYEAMRVWHQHAAQALSFEASESRVAELGWIVENELLLDKLWSALEGVPIYCQASVEAYTVEEGGARIQLQDGREIEAGLIVAADGADSHLRELANIGVAGWDYLQQAIVCHVVTERPHRRTALQRFLPTGPLAFLPLADGRSSVVWSTTEAEVLMQFDDVDFRQHLGRAIEHELGEVLESTQRVAFPLRLLHAREYVKGPLVLLGDAAHVVHPLAGQGVNLGLADAAALAKILLELKAAGRPANSERALRRYERARKAENLEMLALTDALYRAFSLRSPLPGGVLQLGMQALGRLVPLKTLIARRALGLG